MNTLSEKKMRTKFSVKKKAKTKQIYGISLCFFILFFYLFFFCLFVCLFFVFFLHLFLVNLYLVFSYILKSV